MKLHYFLNLLIIFIALSACGRFKVEKLKPHELISVPINSDEKSLQIPMVRDLFFGIPGQVAFTEERLVVAEPSLQQIKVFLGDHLELIIQAKESKQRLPAETTKLANIKAPAGKVTKTVTVAQIQVPGNIVAGRNEDFFVLNKTIIGNSDAGNPEMQSMSGYYKILHFNLKGQLLRTIGRKGQVELPFDNILWFDTDRENRLWVLYRHLGEMVLDAYGEGRLVYSIDQRSCVQNVFAKIEKDKIYTCEFIYPFYRVNRVLMIGKIEKNSSDRNVGGYVFQNRVFKTYDLEKGESEFVFKNLNDPEDYPYLPYDSGKIVIWQTQNDSTFKFALYDLEGDLVNNLQILLPGNRTSWRNTWYLLSGSILSTRVIDNSLKVYQWK